MTTNKTRKARKTQKIQDSNGVVYNSVAEASETLGIPKGSIYGVLNGYDTKAHGVGFKRVGKRISPPHLRNPKSPETRLAMARSHGARPFRDQNGNVYDYVGAAAEALDINRNTIARSLQLGTVTRDGFKFTYLKGR